MRDVLPVLLERHLIDLGRTVHQVDDMTPKRINRTKSNRQSLKRNKSRISTRTQKRTNQHQHLFAYEEKTANKSTKTPSNKPPNKQINNTKTSHRGTHQQRIRVPESQKNEPMNVEATKPEQSNNIISQRAHSNQIQGTYREVEYAVSSRG